jgi:hypothetical protein
VGAARVRRAPGAGRPSLSLQPAHQSLSRVKDPLGARRTGLSTQRNPSPLADSVLPVRGAVRHRWHGRCRAAPHAKLRWISPRYVLFTLSWCPARGRPGDRDGPVTPPFPAQQEGGTPAPSASGRGRGSPPLARGAAPVKSPHSEIIMPLSTIGRARRCGTKNEQFAADSLQITARRAGVARPPDCGDPQIGQSPAFSPGLAADATAMAEPPPVAFPNTSRLPARLRQRWGGLGDQADPS